MVDFSELARTALMASRSANLAKGKDKYQLRVWRLLNLFSCWEKNSTSDLISFENFSRLTLRISTIKEMEAVLPA